MPWPEDALTTDETVIAQFRPHWKLLAVPIGWFILLSFVWGLIINWFNFGGWGLIVYVGFAIWLVAVPAARWYTSNYVLTTERLMTRRGLVAKSGIEIPLENITNVNFRQSVFERAIGAGDLLVESAGESGQSSFVDIPHPDDFQKQLYRIREERKLHLSSPGSAPARGGAGNAEAIEKLAELRDAGHITEDEFEAKRKELLEDM